MYICDFHREQAWIRWTNNSKHGVPAVGKGIGESQSYGKAATVNDLTVLMPSTVSNEVNLSFKTRSYSTG